jgi:hypothetical protein
MSPFEGRAGNPCLANEGDSDPSLLHGRCCSGGQKTAMSARQSHGPPPDQLDVEDDFRAPVPPR